MIPLNLDESSGARIMSARFASGSEECISCNRSGRRNARTNAVKSVASVGDANSTGIEGMYLKAGKRNADAADGLLVAGATEVFVTRTLLKGWRRKSA